MARDPDCNSLLLADVDGTFVTREKVLTETAKRAVADLRTAGIRFDHEGFAEAAETHIPRRAREAQR